MREPGALPLQRLPRQTLHHAWAPKLGRTIVLTSTGQLRLWAMLEAHPGVKRYCERPAWPGDDVPPERGPDFWALRDGVPVWLVLDRDAERSDEPATVAGGPALQTVTAHDLDRHDIWIRNWLSLLPYLGTAALLDGAGPGEPVVEFFRQEASFEEAERHFAHHDPMLVRAAVVAGLHQGLLFSSELLVRPWDGRTRVVCCPPPPAHAPQ